MSSLGSCAICCCSFRPDKISALPCGHTFHYDCVLQWVKTSKTCPSCRVRCLERSVIKTLFFDTDRNATISEGEDELDSVKKQLHEKKQECIEMEKKMKSALSEAAVHLKERGRWQKKAEEGAEATKRVGQLKAMLVDQNEKDKEIQDLRTKVKASRFYQVIASGSGSEEDLNKYIRRDGELDTACFITLLQKQIRSKDALMKQEKKRREEAESNISKYKRLVQELKEKEANGSLVERLNQMSNEKRLSLGGDAAREEFSDSFLGSAMRPAPKGRLNIGRKEEEEHNTFLDIPSASRRGYHPSPEKDIFDVVMPKKVSDRIGHSEKSGNGMGSAFSMKNSADRHILPSLEKENRGKPYVRVVPKKKVVVNNTRMSNFFAKKNTTESKAVDLNATICID